MAAEDGSATLRRAVGREILGRAVGLASIVYLALPVALFLAGWLRPAWGGSRS